MTEEAQNLNDTVNDQNPVPSGEPTPNEGDQPPAEGDTPPGDQPPGEGQGEQASQQQKPTGDRKKRRRNRTEKHIANLTRRAEEAERKAAYLEGQLDAQRQNNQSEPERPIRADFEDDAEYEAELEKYIVAKNSNKQEGRQQQAPQPPQNEPENMRNFREKGLETYGDEFAQVMMDESLPITNTMGQAMLELENGHDIMMYLSDNKSEARRIAKLPMRKQIEELENINEQVGDYSSEDDNTPANSQASPPQKQSSAPPPPSHEKGGEAPPVTDLSKAKNMDDYARIWKTNRAARLKH